MADWDDVARLALALPQTTEGPSWGHRSWKVKGKLFVWERPLRKGDLEALGASAPPGPILGARVEHEIAKSALIADPSGLFFTIPHLDGYPAVLAQLALLREDDLREIVTEAWLVRAPASVVASYLEESDR